MNVVVCLESPAPGPSARAALATALGLGKGVSVIALSAAAGTASKSLELASASRCQRAVLLSDAALADTDYLSLGTVLAAAIKQLGGGLVLMGTTGANEGQAAVPAAVARALGAPLLARVERISFGESSTTAHAEIRHGGRVHELRVPLPAVFTISAGVGAGRRRTRTNLSPPDIENMTLGGLGLDAAAIRRSDALLGEFEEFSGKPDALSSVQSLLTQARGPDVSTRRDLATRPRRR